MVDELLMTCLIPCVQAGKMSARDLLNTIRSVGSSSKTFKAMFDDNISNSFDKEFELSDPVLETFEDFPSLHSAARSS
jgi:hypothetical protein